MPFSAPLIRFTTAGLSALAGTGKKRDLSDVAAAALVLRVGPTGRKAKSRGAPVMANRTAPIISQMFSFGVHRSIVATNPVSLLFKPGGKEYSSDRALSETECHAFLHGVEAVCIAAVRCHTLMVLWLTLVRRGSLAKAEWSEFNFERKEWRIPPPTTRKSENTSYRLRSGRSGTCWHSRR